MDRLNRALALVEERLAAGEDVDAGELARVALTSEHHLRRMFSTLAGMPLSDYVRRRRLTLATAAVVAGDVSVLDVAVRHGWGSDDAFARAFRAWHGITPSQARLAGAVLRSQPRVAFTVAVEGADSMHHRILTTAPFRLVGRHARLPLVHEGENTALAEHDAATAPEVAERALAWADVPGLPGLLSVCSGFEEGRADGSSFDYHRAVATTRPAAELPDDLDVLEVPATTFVAFTAEGTAADGGLARAVQQLWADAYGRWFPANAYRTVDGPEILRLEVDHETGTGRGELWLPVEPETGP